MYSFPPQLRPILIGATPLHHRLKTFSGGYFNRHFGSGIMSREMSQGVHRVGNPVHGSYVDDLENGKEKKALTLFPIGDD